MTNEDLKHLIEVQENIEKSYEQIVAILKDEIKNHKDALKHAKVGMRILNSFVIGAVVQDGLKLTEEQENVYKELCIHYGLPTYEEFKNK